MSKFNSLRKFWVIGLVVALSLLLMYDLFPPRLFPAYRFLEGSTLVSSGSWEPGWQMPEPEEGGIRHSADSGPPLIVNRRVYEDSRGFAEVLGKADPDLQGAGGYMMPFPDHVEFLMPDGGDVTIRRSGISSVSTVRKEGLVVISISSHSRDSVGIRLMRRLSDRFR